MRLPSARPHLPELATAIIVTVIHGAVSLRIHHRFGTGMDLAIFDQGVGSLARGQWPTSAMKTVGMNLWGDHFHPVLVAAVPAYWLRPQASTLLLVQAVALGLTCAIVVRTARRLLPGNQLIPLALGASLAVAPGVQAGMTFDFHEVALGMPLLALALAALLEGRHRAFALWAVSLLLVKEDAGFIAFGLAMAAFVMGTKRLAVALATASVAWTLLVLTVIIPAFSPTGAWLYAGKVAGVRDSLRNALASLDGQQGLGWTVLMMLLAGALLALRSPLVLALLPNLLVRATSGNIFYWGMSYHYNLLPSVIIAFATLDGLRRSGSLLRTLAVGAIIALAAQGVLGGQLWNEYWRPVDQARIETGRRALAQVPVGASVGSDVYLTSQLSPRHPVTQQVRPPQYTDDLGKPIAVDWLVLDAGSRSYGGARNWVPQAIEHFGAQGFTIVTTDGDFTVLHRT